MKSKRLTNNTSTNIKTTSITTHFIVETACILNMPIKHYRLWHIFFKKVHNKEIGLLALLKHRSNTGGRNITAQFSSNFFFKTFYWEFQPYYQVQSTPLWFNQFAFPGDIFPFLWCPAALYEAEMADGVTVIFLLCSKIHKTCFALTKIFIFFAHNSFPGLALPYIQTSFFFPLIVTVPTWQSENSCQWVDLMRHVFAPVLRTAQIWSHMVCGKKKFKKI